MKRLVAPVVLVLLAGCGSTNSPVAKPARHASLSEGASESRVLNVSVTSHPTKLLVVVEENHTFAEAKAGMPYVWSLATKYGYASHYSAVMPTKSSPNYLAIAGGSTFGVIDDKLPSAHPISGASVFDQAGSSRTYAESMPSNCYLRNALPYAAHANPWTYFVDGRTACNSRDISTRSFLADAKNNALPAVGMLIPNRNHQAHGTSTLSTADSWLQQRLPTVLASSDFTSGRLAVVITFDEGTASDSTVLAAVLDVNLHGRVVTTPLNHYSLSRWLSDTVGARPLRNAAAATDMRAAFGL